MDRTSPTPHSLIARRLGTSLVGVTLLAGLVLVPGHAGAESARASSTPPGLAPSGRAGASDPASSAPGTAGADLGTPSSSSSPVTPGEAGAPAVAGSVGHTSTADSEETKEVTIVGTRARETSGSAHILREKQLRRFGQQDPHQVLQSVPGVYVRGEDGFGLRPNIGMRGALSDRSKKLTLMEDGVLFAPAPYSAPAAYYFPLIGRMASVKVVKGPSAIAYGPHTVAGAIDLLTTPVTETRKALLDLTYGSFESRKAHVRFGVGDDKLAVLIEGMHLDSGGFKQLDGGGDTGFSRNEWMAKARTVLSVREGRVEELELKASYSDEVSHETYLGLTDEDFQANPYRRYASSQLDTMRSARTSVALTHTLRGARSTLKTTAYRHDLGRVWRKVNAFQGAPLESVLSDPSSPANAPYYAVLTGRSAPTTTDQALLIGPNDRSFVAQGVQTTYGAQPKTGPISHRIELSARLHGDSIRRHHTEDAFVVGGSSLRPAGTATRTTADNDASTIALAASALDAMTWGRFTLTTGARVESIQSELSDALDGREERMTQQVLLPGAGLFVTLPRDLGAFVGVYRGFSPIPPGQTSVVVPEKSTNYETGVRWSPRQLRMELTGFFNDYENLSNVCTFSTGCVGGDLDRQFDGGRAKVFGLEAYVESERKLGPRWSLPGRVAYTFTRAQFSNGFTSADPIFGEVRAGDLLPYVPAHQLTNSVGLEEPRGGAHVGMTWVSAMRETAGRGTPAREERTDTQLTFDASASVRPREGLTVYLNGRNLLDQAYIVSHRPFGARPGSPRWLELGLRYEL